MKTNNNNLPVEFTKNEKEIIRLLLDNGRITDIEMAGKLKISAQAVGKIRKKLEDNGIIEGYSCNLNFKKMGIGMLCVCMLKLKNKFYETIENHNVKEFLKNIPTSIFTCTPASSEISVISLYGFRNAEEMEKYAHLTKTKLHDYGEVVRIYPFSPYGLVKISPTKLFNLILDDKPNTPISPSNLAYKNKD